LAYSRRLKHSARTNGKGFSSWPTARVAVGEYTRDRGQKGAERPTLKGTAVLWKTPSVPNGGRAMPEGMTLTGRKQDGTKGQVELEHQAKMWGTPRASDADQGWSQNLNDVAEQGTWPTPRVQMAKGAGGNQQGAADLQTVVSTWPTPAARDHKGSSPASVTRVNGKTRMDLLDFRAELGFHHQDQPTASHGVPSSDWRPISRRLLRSAISSVGQTTLLRWLRKDAWRKRRLNPIFVAWLMRWPSGHALCAFSETEWTHWSQDMRGALSALPMASGPWIWEPKEEAAEAVQFQMFSGGAE